ncbi:MAG: hypothetical protein JXD22_11185 [Sedimentisphaerales bacterium]|nr:hypothetical protein [Sedimentisphaerales bacterium]
MKIILNIIAVFLTLAVAGCSTTAPVDQAPAELADSDSQTMEACEPVDQQTPVTVDESTQTEPQSTPAAEEATPTETESSATKEQTPWTPEITPRGWGEHYAYFAGLDVKHYPLYMTDPHYLADSEDGYFKTWDGESALDTVAGPIVFLGNVLALPVAAAFDPPWKTQTSRGQFPIAEPTHEIPLELSGMVECERIGQKEQK